MRYFMVFLALLGILLPVGAVQFRSGDTVTLGDNTVLQDDLLISGGTVTVDQEIAGDLLIAAGTATVNRIVRGNLLVTGGTVTIRVPVNGSVYIAGGTVTVDAPIGRNLVIAGGTVDVGPTANIARDVAIAGGNVTLAGMVNRNVMVNSGTLNVSRSANITGDLRARVGTPTIDPEATIGGKRDIQAMPEQASRKHHRSPLGWVLMLLFCTIWHFIAGSILLGSAPRLMTETVGMIGTRPWASVLSGFVLFLIAPLIFLVLLLVLPVAFIFLSLYLIALYLAPIALALLVGKLVLRGRSDRPYLSLAVGMGLLFLVQLVPGVGMLVVFIAALFGLGALLLALYERSRRPQQHMLEEQPQVV